MADINQILQTKANLYTPNARVDDTNLVGFNGNPSLIVEDPGLTVGERALLNAGVTSLYCNNDGTYYVKTPTGWEELGGTGGSFSGDNIVLETLDSNWRIINDDPYLRFQRRLNDGTDSWRTYATMGSSISTDGIVLTRPYQVSYDLANTLDSDELPDLAEVITLSGVEENIVYGNSRKQTILNTQRGTDVKVAHALTDQREIENRPLNDKVMRIDRTDGADPALAEISYVADINFSAGEIDYIRFLEIGFDVIATSRDGEANPDDQSVPIRIAVETLEGQLIQENVSEINLDAGVKNSFAFKQGFDFYRINPVYEERQDARVIIKLKVQKGEWVELKAGEYSYEDELGDVYQQDVPYQKSIIEYYELDKMMSSHNFNDVLTENSAVTIEGGALNLRLKADLDGDGNDDIDQTHHLVGPSEHVDIRNPQVGNFFDKTYVNSGAGGIWSIIEDPTATAEFVPTKELAAVDNAVAIDQWLEVTEVKVDFNGALTREFELLDGTWNTANLTSIDIFTDVQDETDPMAITQLPYRVGIYTETYNSVLQENMTDFMFRDGQVQNGYTINTNPNPGTALKTRIKLPKDRFTINETSERYITVYFNKPVKVLGWYDNPADPLDPQPSEFVASSRLNVIKASEEEILTGGTIEEKLNEIVGSEEYREAVERDLNTLHIDPLGQQVLADRHGNWIYFWNSIGNYEVFDKHQYIYRSGREVIYQPNETCFDNESYPVSTDNYVKADPMVVHIDSPSNVQFFNVSLLADENVRAAQESGTNGIEYTFFINTYKNANSHSVTVSVPWGYSMQYVYTMDRNNLYTYRAHIFEENLASVIAPTFTEAELAAMPADPNA